MWKLVEIIIDSNNNKSELLIKSHLVLTQKNYF